MRGVSNKHCLLTFFIVFALNQIMEEPISLLRVKHVQFSSFIMLSLGPIIMNQVINELCYKGTILQRNYRKMTISWSWSFSCNFFVKFYCKKFGSHNMDCFISNSML